MKRMTERIREVLATKEPGSSISITIFDDGSGSVALHKNNYHYHQTFGDCDAASQTRITVAAFDALMKALVPAPAPDNVRNF